MHIFNKHNTKNEDRKKFISDDFPEYHLGVLNEINNRFSFEGKSVIDVGGSNIPEELMKDFGVNKFVCLDPITKWRNGDFKNTCFGKKVFNLNQYLQSPPDDYSYIIDDDVENTVGAMNEQFDIVISISTFEHVSSLDKTLVAIYNMLRPGGIVFSQYEPLFSSAVGHHVYINNEFNFNNMPEIEFMHLLYNEEEAKKHLKKIARFSNKIQREIINQAYKSKLINRLKLSDHINSYQNSPFNNFSIDYFILHPIDRRVEQKLKNKFGIMRYDVKGIRYVATKT